MSPRRRVVVCAAVAAAGAAALAVGVTLATRTDVEKRRPVAAPPFLPDPTAPPAVAREVQAALRAWPNGTLARLRTLSARHPKVALVRFELALIYAVAGTGDEFRRFLRAAKRVQPDSPSAVRADDLLHLKTPRGRPPFVPSFERATTPAQALLLRGAAFQQALRPVSAERAFAAAARAAPDDAEAQVAAAVGLYDKDRPALAFSRLGPLVKRFPRAQTVRFHLGLLLIYFGDLPRAGRELALARAQGPRTLLGTRAVKLLQAVRKS